VKARLRLMVRKGALVIPAVAIQRGPQGAFFYSAKGDQAELRPVVVERIEGEDALISQGLAPGDKVVREGQSQLRPGARLALREGSAAGKGAAPPPTPTAPGIAPGSGSGAPPGGQHQGHKPL
jgi:membrane fusion protein, multidrug efflux system